MLLLCFVACIKQPAVEEKRRAQSRHEEGLHQTLLTGSAPPRFRLRGHSPRALRNRRNLEELMGKAS